MGDDKKMKIAIDGFSKCGKSTLAKRISQKFGFLYIDSGALYRITAFFLNRNQNINEADMVFLDNVTLNSRGSIFFEGQNYDVQIGLPEVNAVVSDIAKIPTVRESVNNWIYRRAGEMSVVMDGRDIGTTVFPDADVKLYLYASVDYRMEGWRRNQLKRVGSIDQNIEEQERANIIKRDYDDLHRKVAPLQKAVDAFVFDMGEHSIDEVFEFVCAQIQEIMK